VLRIGKCQGDAFGHEYAHRNPRDSSRAVRLTSRDQSQSSRCEVRVGFRGFPVCDKRQKALHSVFTRGPARAAPPRNRSLRAGPCRRLQGPCGARRGRLNRHGAIRSFALL
jgi:hypothetical protein